MSRIVELEALIKHHRAAYYSGKPEISDSAYDKLEFELKNLDPSNSLFSSVGFDISKSTFTKVKHTHPMKSIGKIYNDVDLKKWHKDFDANEEYVCSEKIDGFAISLKYNYNSNLDKYIFVSGCTRGDGDEGEDITENIKMISDIPFTLPNLSNMDKNIEVRGEIYMKKAIFNELIKNNLISADSSIRNIAPGSARQHDPNITKERKLSFFAYDLIGSDAERFNLRLVILARMGFIIVPHGVTLGNGANGISFIYSKIEAKRDKLEYNIDGMVVRVNSNKKFESLGYTGHHHRAMIAYKFCAEEEETTLDGIEWSISRTGQLNPVALIKPVVVAGATISRVSLHNISIVRTLNINVGDNIMVSRRGDVIPHIEEVTKKNSVGIINMPKHCPACGSDTKLEIGREAEYLYCTNPFCEGRLIESLDYFAATMEMKGVSTSIIEKLYNAGMLLKFEDFYTLKDNKNKMLQLDGIRDRSVEKILDAVESSKESSFAKLLEAMGIKHLGTKVSTILADKYDINNIFNVTENDLLKISGIGTEIAREVVAGLKLNRTTIEKMNGYLITKTFDILSDSLRGKSFCITGTLFFDRDSIHDIIKQNSGVATKSVTKTLSYLIVGENEGASKIEKAKKCGIKIITEDEFVKMLGKDYRITVSSKPDVKKVKDPNDIFSLLED